MLYVVAGPIGNMSDITLNAIQVLKSVDLILSEDTRETAKVLQKYQIVTPQISYRDQNHDYMMPKINDLLAQGKKLALVSDSGTPVISDPGFKLVRDLVGQGIKVTAVPGPSAVIAALSISGLPTDKFTFLGFLPKTPSKRREILAQYGALDCTLTIYESPFRVKRLLEEIYEILGDREAFLANDLTKLYEKTWSGKLSTILEQKDSLPTKGEWVILISKSA